MITRLTKIQLMIFAIVTVLGGAFVGGRYANLDRLVVDRSFPVTADFRDSGGIFAGAEVTYRGIAVGKVGKLVFTESGVRATLDIENDAPKISDDATATVANKSAVGEQFIDLQPQSNSAPYLKGGSNIPLSRTVVPIDTTKFLLDTNAFVRSIDTEAMSTLVNELGLAFAGDGRDLSTIIDAQMSFIQTADDNFEVTRSLIRGSSSVLQTFLDKRGQFSSFTNDLALLTDTLVRSDKDIRRLFDEGSSSARLVKDVFKENNRNLQSFFNDFNTFTESVDEFHKGIEVISILFPYLVHGSFTATSRPNPATLGRPDRPDLRPSPRCPPITTKVRCTRPACSRTVASMPRAIGNAVRRTRSRTSSSTLEPTARMRTRCRSTRGSWSSTRTAAAPSITRTTTRLRAHPPR